MTRSICWAGSITIALCLGFGAVAYAAPSARMLIETTDFTGLSISPDGKRYAFRTERASIGRNTYDSTWYVGGVMSDVAPTAIADGGVPIRAMGLAMPQTPQWSANGQWLYFLVQLNAQVQVWRARTDGSIREAVTHDRADVRAFYLSEDGQRLIYQVGASREDIQLAEAAEYDAGIRIDGRVPVGQGLYRSGYINGALATERYAGNWVIRQGLLDDRAQILQCVDLKTLLPCLPSATDQNDFEAKGPQSLTKTYGPLSWAARSHSGQIAYLKASDNQVQLRLFDPRRESEVVCTDPACGGAHVRALAWRPGHDDVIVTVSDLSRAQTLYDWNIASGRLRRIAKADGLLNGGRQLMGGESCAIGASDAICVAAGANLPPRLERVNLESGQRHIIFEPNGALAQATGPAAEILTWQDKDKHTFTGQYFPPVQAGLGPAPLVISYYTCPGFLRGGDAGDEWPLATLAGDGIAALCINMVSDPDATINYRIAESGIRAIVDRLTTEGRIDRGRIGMAGQSFGSETVWWMAEKTNLLKAGAVTSTPVNPTYYWFHSIQPGFAQTLMNRWQLGEPEETPGQWQLLSPVYQIDRIRSAMLLQMPEQEYLQTMEIFGRLSRTTTPVDLYAFPNEPHNKFMPRHQLAAYTRNLDWFRFWLQDFEDPDPAKAEQYRLWRAMRAKQAPSAAASPGRQ